MPRKEKNLTRHEVVWTDYRTLSKVMFRHHFWLNLVYVSKIWFHFKAIHIFFCLPVYAARRMKTHKMMWGTVSTILHMLHFTQNWGTGINIVSLSRVLMSNDTPYHKVWNNSTIPLTSKWIGPNTRLQSLDIFDFFIHHIE